MNEIVLGIELWILSTLFYLFKANLDKHHETQRDLPLNMIVHLYSLILTGLLMVGIKENLLFDELNRLISSYVLFPMVFLLYFFMFLFLECIKKWEEQKQSIGIYKHLKRTIYAWVVIPIICYSFNKSIEISFYITLMHQVAILTIILASISLLIHKENLCSS